MWQVETSPLGRIVVPPSLPAGYALFFSTADFPGRLDGEAAGMLLDVVRGRFGIDAELTTCRQVHSAAVARGARGRTWGECDACDALWSDERHVALGIKVADCLPVVMIDPAHDVIANVHSGWRGAVQRVTAVTLDTLARETAFDAASASAWLGPAIRACCFEVGEEVVEALASSYDEVERYVDRSGPKPHVDLPALTVALLRERGLAAERIFDSALCTRCEGSIFHSFRRDGSGGRNLSVVAH